jgi:mannose-6-phosphate isomerase-like protein (cupin superfamily)
MRRQLEAEARHFPADVSRVRPDAPGAAKWAWRSSARCSPTSRSRHIRGSKRTEHESEQIMLVLDGELFFDIASKRIAVRAGEVIAIPSNAEHSAWTEERGARAVDAWSPVRRDYLT